ncbi:MAG: hypothetical protein M3552_14910 [Planctomycetota bacterium]|nr:hypothetical protein [Planctomycetaceae bacterium]MDQ3331919.1 hypothetical protein [Planctomycetota bacterium]
MKALLIAVVVVALMVLFGWLTFTSVGGKPSVTLNTEHVREDTGEAAEAAKGIADKTAKKSREIVDEVRRTDVNVDVDVDRKPETAE